MYKLQLSKQFTYLNTFAIILSEKFGSMNALFHRICHSPLREKLVE